MAEYNCIQQTSELQVFDDDDQFEEFPEDDWKEDDAGDESIYWQADWDVENDEIDFKTKLSLYAIGVNPLVV
jgi:26 proteasome complex subunit DSS1